MVLILDEIFTGFARTGTMFAMNQAGIVPDIVCSRQSPDRRHAPARGNGRQRPHLRRLPLGRSRQALMHGPTYMGNALACAAANASLDLFETEPRLQQVAAIEAQLRMELEACRHLTGVVDVRVRGALGVVQLSKAGEGPWFRPRFLEDGVWIRPFGDIIYVAPPFVISTEELSRYTQAIVRHVSAWSQQRAAA